MWLLRWGPLESFPYIGELCRSALSDSANDRQDLLSLFSSEGAMRVDGNYGTHGCNLRPACIVVNALTNKDSPLYEIILVIERR